MTNGRETRIIIDLNEILATLERRIKSAHVAAARGKLDTARCCAYTLATALSQFWNP